MHSSWVVISPSMSANSLSNSTPSKPLDPGLSWKSVPSSQKPAPAPLKPETTTTPAPAPLEPVLAPTSLYYP